MNERTALEQEGLDKKASYPYNRAIRLELSSSEVRYLLSLLDQEEHYWLRFDGESAETASHRAERLWDKILLQRDKQLK